ncbi:MAG: fibronectin type III domain-containing protein [Lachnospiraceae bacterium]
MSMYKDVKKRILAGVLAALMVVSTLSIGSNLFADYTSSIGETLLEEGQYAQIGSATKDYQRLDRAAMKVDMDAMQSVDYTVSVYQNLADASDPTSGVLRYTSSQQHIDGTSESTSARELSLDLSGAGIYLSSGETYAVVFNFTSVSDAIYYYTAPGTGYYYEGAWDGRDGMIETGLSDVSTDTVSDNTTITAGQSAITIDATDTQTAVQASLSPALKRTLAYTADANAPFTVNPNGSISLNADVTSGSGNVTVSAVGTGSTASIKVNILEASIAEGTYTYTGESVEPAVTVKCGSTVLTQGRQYNVTYNGSTGAGEAVAKITGIGDYAGYSKELTYTIGTKALPQDAGAKFSVDIASNTVTNGIYSDGGKALTFGTDYTAKAVLKGNQVESGQLVYLYDITATGIGNYTGTQTYNNYEIKAGSDNKFDISQIVSAELSQTSYTYDGLAKEPAVTFKNATTNEAIDGFGDNCNIEYAHNVEVGRATVTITGKEANGYTGTIVLGFDINRCDLEQAQDDDKLDITASIDGVAATTFAYTGKKIEPVMTVTLTRDNSVYTLVQDQDYTVTYSKNTAIGTMSVEISGAGNNFQGTVTKQYQILGDFETAAVVSIGNNSVTYDDGYASDYTATYTGSEIQPKVSVKMGSSWLKEKTDYTVSYEYNINASTDDQKAVAVIKGAGNYSGKEIHVTFTIKPQTISGTLNVSTKKTYTGKEITLSSGEYTLTKTGKTYVEGQDFELSYEDNTNAGTATVYANGIGNYTGSVKATFTIQKLSLTDSHVVVEPKKIADQIYTGNQIKPDITLYYQDDDGTKREISNANYSLSYSNNKNIGQATITIKGEKNLMEERNEYFSIVARSLSNLTFILGGQEVKQIAENTYLATYVAEYTGRTISPSLTVKDGDSTVTKSGNYKTSSVNAINAASYDENNISKTPAIMVTGVKNYVGSTVTIYYTIAPKDITSEASGITITDTQKLEPKEDYRLPIVEVRNTNLNDKLLTQDTDYTVTAGEDSKTSGEGKIATITGKGNYTGSRKITYTIGSNLAIGGAVELCNPYDDSTLKSTSSGDYYVPYWGRGDDGNSVKPVSKLTYTDGEGKSVNLTENTDYTVSYTTEAGGMGSTECVVITYTGKGEYYGTLTRRYYVTVVVLNNDGNVTVTNKDPNHSGTGFDYVYNGNKITPQLEVTYTASGKTIKLVEGTDYQFTAMDVGPNVGKYTVQAKGIGHYGGTLSQVYTIAASELSTCKLSSNILPDYTYTGKEIKPDVSGITITNTAGTVLKQDVDYKVKGYSNNTAIANKGDAKAPTVTLMGIGNYTGTVDLKFSIVTKSISDSVTVEAIPDQMFTGEKLTPSVSLMYGDVVLKENTDYKLTYSSNVNPGKATIAIEGIGAYSGTLTAKFNILGDLSNANLFTVSGYQNSYKLNADGTLGFSDAGVHITYTNAVNVDSSGNFNKLILDRTNYEIQQYNCDTPGQGELVFVGKNYCIGSQIIPIKVIGDLNNASVVNVNEQYDYTGRQIKPTPIVQYGSQVLSEGQDYTLEYGDNVAVGKNAGNIVIRMKSGTDTYYTGTKQANFNIYYNLSKATVTGLDNTYSYNGSEIKPKPQVTCAGKILQEGADYSLTYTNNTDAGTASLVINSVDDVSIGNQVINFEIKGINLADSGMNITLDGQSSVTTATYTGDYIQPKVVVTYGSKTLTQTKDYNVSYAENLNVGTASVTISGAGSYYGAVTKNFTIVPKNLAETDINVKVSNAGYAGGHKVVPQMSITYNGHTLQEGTDYTCDLSNNEHVSVDSKASATFIGKGNYTGTRTAEFEVTKVNLAGGTVKLDKTSAVYTGEVITPEVEVSCPIGDGTTYILQKDIDYTINYGNGIKDAGKYNISIRGDGNFYGSLHPTFTVEPKSIAADDITVSIPDMDYTGSAVEPKLVVTDTTRGVELVKGTDYDVTFKNNTNSASKDDADAAPTVKITGKGNYGESREATFNIGKSLANAQVRIAQDQQEFTYDGTSHIPTYAVYLSDGTLLQEGTDYELIDIEDSINAGTKMLAVKGIGNYYGKPFAYYRINQKVAKAAEIDVVLDLPQDKDGNYVTTYTGGAITPAIKVYDTSISTKTEVDPINYSISYVNNENIGSVDSPAFAVVSLKGNYALGSETKSQAFVIKAKDISKFKLVLNDKRVIYTGNAITPDVSVMYDNGVDPVWTLTAGVDYDLKLTDNTNAGHATVTAVAKGNYTGEVSEEFDIVASLKDAKVTIEPQFYTGKAIEPPVTVECGGNVLEKDVDYKVDYYSDDNYTTGGYVIITPLASYYSDSARCAYTISADMSLLRVKNYANQYTYTGKAIKPDFVIEDPSGNKVDYDASAVVYGRMNADEAAATDIADVKEDACVNIGTITAFIPVSLAGKSEVMRATYEIIPKNVNACNIIQLSKNTYTGKAIEPKATLLYDGKELIQGTEYSVVYNNNVNPGVATATVQGLGNYTGTSVIKFNIIAPVMVGLRAQAASESSIQVAWLKNGKATGYEIYSEDNRIKYGETSSTHFVVNGLKNSTTYTFHVRSYVTVGGNTTYGKMKPVTAYTKVASTDKLVGTSTAKRTATLTWDRSNTVGGYEIYRSTTENGTYKKIAVVPNGKGAYTDNTVGSNRTYYYKVRAYKPINGSYVYGDYSKTIAITVK